MTISVVNDAASTSGEHQKVELCCTCCTCGHVHLTCPSYVVLYCLQSSMAQDLLSLSKQALEQYSPSLKGSLLYLDSGAAEAIAANVGLEWLLSRGVIHVCALETASKRQAPYSANCDSLL